MQVLRTPEGRFAGLPDFGYQPSYAEVSAGEGPALRMAWVEAGPADGPVVLLLHGEPTWSFLYRKMLPPLADAGLRAVAPDLVGFGRSDKPADRAEHSYARQLAWLRALVVDRLGLTDVTLVCQDWGGLLGLRLVAAEPDRFARVVAANTGLPTGDQQMTDVWWAFRSFTQQAEELPIGRLVAAGCAVPPPPEVVAGYEAPFPDETYKAGPRALPALVPTSPEDPEAGPNRAALAALGRYQRPFLTTFGAEDQVTRFAYEPLQRLVPGAAGQPHRLLAAGHFIQEDAGPELADLVVDFVRHT